MTPAEAKAFTGAPQDQLDNENWPEDGMLLLKSLPLFICRILHRSRCSLMSLRYLILLLCSCIVLLAEGPWIVRITPGDGNNERVSNEASSKSSSLRGGGKPYKLKYNFMRDNSIAVDGITRDELESIEGVVSVWFLLSPIIFVTHRLCGALIALINRTYRSLIHTRTPTMDVV